MRVVSFKCFHAVAELCGFLYILVLLQTMKLQPPKSIHDAYVLLNLGDSVTTDHISPAGNIARNSPAARYLTSRG